MAGALCEGGDLDGLIGRNVGPAVRNLPSNVYWNSLRSYGILRHDGTMAQVAGLRQITSASDDATEFIERSDAVWAPSIPAPPDDFFSLTRCDFALTHDVATWLAERIVDAAPETLLQHLVASGNRASPSAGFVWDDPEAAAATGRIRGALNEARRLALLVHGAMLLYNLLLAERAEELGLTEHDGLRDAFSTQLSDWRDEAEACDLGAWDLERLWTLVAEQGRPVAAPTR